MKQTSACFGAIKATFDNAMRAIDCEIEKTDSLVKTTEVGYQFSTEMQEQVEIKTIKRWRSYWMRVMRTS